MQGSLASYVQHGNSGDPPLSDENLPLIFGAESFRQPTFSNLVDSSVSQQLAGLRAKFPTRKARLVLAVTAAPEPVARAVCRIFHERLAGLREKFPTQKARFYLLPNRYQY